MGPRHGPLAIPHHAFGWVRAVLALAIVAALNTPAAAKTPSPAPSNLPDGIFSNDGPTFVYSSKDWTLYVPLVNAKNSGKARPKSMFAVVHI